MGYPDNPLIYDMLKDEMILIKKGLNGFANDDIMLISDKEKDEMIFCKKEKKRIFTTYSEKLMMHISFQFYASPNKDLQIMKEIEKALSPIIERLEREKR